MMAQLFVLILMVNRLGQHLDPVRSIMEVMDLIKLERFYRPLLEIQEIQLMV